MAIKRKINRYQQGGGKGVRLLNIPANLLPAPNPNPLGLSPSLLQNINETQQFQDRSRGQREREAAAKQFREAERQKALNPTYYWDEPLSNVGKVVDWANANMGDNDLSTAMRFITEGVVKAPAQGGANLSRDTYGSLTGEGENRLGAHSIIDAANAFAPAVMEGINVGMTGLKKLPSSITALGNKYLPNAHKLNPFAFKPNPESFYRTLGQEGYQDALQSQMLRANPEGAGGQQIGSVSLSRPSDVPYFAKGEIGNYPGNEIVAEVNSPMYRRGDINPVTGFPIKGRHWGYRNINKAGEASNVPIQNVNFLEKNWLSGYRKIPQRPIGGSTQEITRGPIDWADAVNRKLNPNFDARAYENTVKDFSTTLPSPDLMPYIDNPIQKFGGFQRNKKRYGY